MDMTEMEALLTTGIGIPGRPLNPRTIERDFRFLLERSKDIERNPVDIKYFDTEGPKGSPEICGEIAEYNCAVWFNRETERLQRLARSAKTHTHAGPLQLTERLRRYRNQTDDLITEEVFAFSETMHLYRSMAHIDPGSREQFRETILGPDQTQSLLGDEMYCEQPDEAMQRTLLEEPTVYVADRTRFNLKAKAEHNRSIDDPRILRESRVYIGMQSRVATYHGLLLWKPEEVPLHLRTGFWYADDKVDIYCDWGPIVDPTDLERSLRYAAAA